MNKEFPFYTKSLDGVSFYQIDEDKVISIEKEIGKHETSYRLFKIKQKYLESPFHNMEEYQSTKEEFESIKYEFLNWVDQTFER